MCVFVQTDPKVFDDAISLLTFYLYNNTTLQGVDRMKVKSFLFQFLHEFFFVPRSDKEQNNYFQFTVALGLPKLPAFKHCHRAVCAWWLLACEV